MMFKVISWWNGGFNSKTIGIVDDKQKAIDLLNNYDSWLTLDRNNINWTNKFDWSMSGDDGYTIKRLRKVNKIKHNITMKATVKFLKRDGWIIKDKRA